MSTQKDSHPKMEELMQDGKTPGSLGSAVSPPRTEPMPGDTSTKISNRDMMKAIGGSGTKMF